MDQQTEGKWLINGTKHHKDSCKAWNTPAQYPSTESKYDTEDPKLTYSIQYSNGMAVTSSEVRICRTKKILIIVTTIIMK